MTTPSIDPQPGRPTFAAGPVTGGRTPAPPWSAPVPAPPPSPSLALADVITSGRPPRERRRTPMFWYGGAAGVVLVTGLVVVLVLLLNGQLGSGKGPLAARPHAPTDVRPPLVRLCPPPSVSADSSDLPVPPVPAGPRTSDPEAGISYAAYGEPWVAWDTVWRMGTLEVPYGVGQHFVTEMYPGGEYQASILSAAVVATVNDSTAIDLDCTGRQVAADVRAEYYPQPNTSDVLREEHTTLGGRQAWVTKFRLHFNEQGLRAKGELVGLALIDVGKPTAAVIYVSIPDTNPEWEHVVDEVLASVRPI